MWTKLLLSRSSSYHCDLPFSKFMTIWPFTKWTSTYSTKIIHMINLKITFSDSFHLLMTDFESVIDFIYLFCRWFICHVTAPYVRCWATLDLQIYFSCLDWNLHPQGPRVIFPTHIPLKKSWLPIFGKPSGRTLMTCVECDVPFHPTLDSCYRSFSLCSTLKMADAGSESAL